MTNTFRHNWFPLLFVRVVPNHLTGSHIARELCRRKDPSALFGTIKFTLLLGRKKRVTLHGLYSLEIIQLPHLHQIPSRRMVPGSAYVIIPIWSLPPTVTHSAYAGLLFSKMNAVSAKKAEQ